MNRLRLLILSTAFFFMASVAWADDLGFVDCSSHPDATPVYSKARQTPDSVGAIPCGERFTVLLYGFIFSRVQTKDGKVGYVYSNLITVDRGGAAQAQAASARMPAAAGSASAANAPAKTVAAAQPSSPAQMDSPPVTTSPAPAKPAAPQVGSFPTPPSASDTASVTAQVQSFPARSVPASASQPQSAPAQPAATQSAQAPVTSTAPASAATPSLAASAQSAPPQTETRPASPQPAPGQSSTSPGASTTPQASAPAQPGPLFPTPPPPPPPSSASDASPAPATAAEPAPAAASEPQPEAAQPAAAPVRTASVRSSWEKPLPSARHGFLVELYSGYAFDRLTSGGSSTNLSGGMGSFGYNLKPWLQIVGDTSYNVVTASGVKNVLYGNHFGGRVFYGRGSRWGLTPFAEALVGGSRFDVTVSGVGGYKASQNCISYKAGGGLDFRVGRRWEIRVIDVDYYRTSFGTGYTQNNYWASAGVVLRIFGGTAGE